jgi:hypothetical protein
VGGLIDGDRLYSVGVIVRDLEAATLRYAEIFGIDEWDVRDFGPDRLTDVTVRGRAAAPTFRTAIGRTVPHAEGSPMGGAAVPVTFELVQPLQGESSFQEFRFVRGQGIIYLTLAVCEQAEFEQMRANLERRGIRLASSMVVDGRLARHFIDTRATVGGYLVEVKVPLEPGTRTDLEVTERWNHAGRYRRPEGLGPLAAQGGNHFGVVVDDVMASLERYYETLGVPSWNMRDWRTEPGRLEAPYYRGEPVDDQHFTSRTEFRDFGLEIIQPTLGPSHYNREFRDLWGGEFTTCRCPLPADGRMVCDAEVAGINRRATGDGRRRGHLLLLRHLRLLLGWAHSRGVASGPRSRCRFCSARFCC